MNEDYQSPKFDSDDDLDAFEQQLRGISPAPPSTTWESLAATLPMTERAAVRRAPAPRWPRIVSHAAATMVGVGIGAVAMLMLHSAATIDPAADGEIAQQVEESSTQTPELVFEDALPPIRRQNVVYRASGNRIIRPWPVESVTPLNVLRPRRSEWINTSRPADEEQTGDPTTPWPTLEPDDPLAAPRLMEQLLNELSSTTDQDSVLRAASLKHS